MDNGDKPFSERHGYNKPKLPQLRRMDDDLRNGLWNAFYESFLSHPLYPSSYRENSLRVCKMIIIKFLKGCADEYDKNDVVKNKNTIKNIFRISEWHTVFDLIEFVTRHSGNKDFVNQCNTVLERENSAYRIINGVVTEITSEQEIEAIETALQIPYASAKEHIDKALTLLSDRENPDYENSIKESISAVESIAKEITGKEKSLNALTQELKLHTNFTKGLDKLYNWSSKEFRHGTSGELLKIDPDTARFMLVICSAFVNYIISQNLKS